MDVEILRQIPTQQLRTALLLRSFSGTRLADPAQACKEFRAITQSQVHHAQRRIGMRGLTSARLLARGVSALASGPVAPTAAGSAACTRESSARCCRQPRLTPRAVGPSQGSRLPWSISAQPAWLRRSPAVPQWRCHAALASVQEVTDQQATAGNL